MWASLEWYRFYVCWRNFYWKLDWDFPHYLESKHLLLGNECSIMSDSTASSVYHRILTCRLIGKQQFKNTSSMFIFDWQEIILVYVVFLFPLYEYYIYFLSVIHCIEIRILRSCYISHFRRWSEFRMYMYMCIYHHYHHRRRQKRKDSGLMLPSQSGCFTLHFIPVFSMWSELSSTYLSVCLSMYVEINNEWLTVYNF